MKKDGGGGGAVSWEQTGVCVCVYVECSTSAAGAVCRAGDAG